jgi:hypothetical protein
MRHSDGASFRQAPSEELGRRSLPRAPRRLDFGRFRVGDDELEVGFVVALELAARAARAGTRCEPHTPNRTTRTSGETRTGLKL